MLIMPTTTTNFQALADGIVDDFFRNDVPLTDGIAKIAIEREFTPEEITRLTEKTNTTASLYFLKTAEDKKSSFKLAELEDVLRRTHVEDNAPKTGEGQEKTASGVIAYAGLPKRKTPQVDLAAYFFGGREKASLAKTASTPKPQVDMAGIFSLEKDLAERKQAKMAMELAVQDGIDFLASEFHVWNGPDFGKFAADSLSAYGDMSMPILEGLAAYLRVPATVLEKSAAEVSRDYVDDTTPHMKVMAGICDGMRRIVKLASEIQMLERSLKESWETVKGGVR